MTASGPRTDDEARRLIHDALDETLVVEASAGTGKTTELVGRVVRVLAEGRATVRELVVVTFTEKAAGELKLRLRQGLEHARRLADRPEAAARLDDAVQNLEEAHVSTIHGFCADLLRERPVEARIDPLFTVLSEGQARRLFDAAFDAWFQACVQEPPEGMRRSLRRAGRAVRPGDADEDGPVERLRRAGFELTEWRDFTGAWTRPPFDRRTTAARAVDLVHGLARASVNASYAGDNLSLDTEPARRVSRDLADLDVMAASESDLDDVESRLIALHRDRAFKRARKGSGPTYAKGVPRAQVLAARDLLVQALDEFRLAADADLAALLHEELRDAVARYEALKAREGALDYLDLLLRARTLVCENDAVRQHFQARYRRLFVDEFQDTDPLQAEILLLLSAADPGERDWTAVRPVPGKLFVVGDPKQSIYRFRRADVEIYRRVCEQLVAAGATRVELRRSFRSVPNIQRLVNLAFAPRMDGNVEARQARYVPLEAARLDEPGQPSVVVLPVPAPYAYRFVSPRAIETSLPDAVGAYVEWLVHQSGWTVGERRRPGRVPLQARHICLLFRRFVSYGTDVTRPYLDALEARGLPHLLVGGRAFHDREEIETLRAALRAIEWPEDELSVFATLRGALFAIGDEELLEYHHVHGRLRPFARPAEVAAHLTPILEALAILEELHRARNRRPVAETVTALMAATRAHVGFVLRPGGEQVLANVLHVAELARQYELDGGMSFRGFVDVLQAAAEDGTGAEAPILEEASDGVRLMTVHKAKGLEFPVVILADLTCRLAPKEPTRYVDAARGICAMRIGGWSPADLNAQGALELLREEKEGERVAYVAATRARDLLVVPAVGDVPYDEGWTSPLNDAIYPPEATRREHRPAAGCPPFKSRDTVLERPNGDPATRLTVCPGAHVLGDGEGAAEIVWWSPEPGVLALGARAPFGLRRDDLIVRDVEPGVLRGHLDEYRRWRAGLDYAVARASAPSLVVRTATEMAASAEDDVLGDDVLRARVDVVIVPEDGAAEPRATDGAGAGQPRGVRFGTLVHAVLADVPLGRTAADPAVVERIARAHGRLLGSGEAEIAAAVGLATRVLAHPAMAGARTAADEGRCRREAPVTLRHGTTLVEGTVDLLFEEGDGLVVVDFKTGGADARTLAIYRRQLAVYVAAVSRALARPARGVLLATSRPAEAAAGGQGA